MPKDPTYTYYCRRGHSYVSPIEATAISCGECNQRNPSSQNLMKKRKVAA